MKRWTSIEQYPPLVLSTIERMARMTGQDSGNCFFFFLTPPPLSLEQPYYPIQLFYFHSHVFTAFENHFMQWSFSSTVGFERTLSRALKFHLIPPVISVA